MAGTWGNTASGKTSGAAPGRSGGWGNTADGPARRAPARGPHRGGFWSHIPGSKIVSQTGKDLYHAALGTPAGLYEVGKAVVMPAVEDVRHGPSSKQAQRARQRQTDLAKGQVHALGQDVHHPLRHPGLTALDALAVVSLGAGSVARAGALGRLAREGGSLSDAARVVRHGPEPGVRTFKSGELEVHTPASRSALTRGIQRQTDRARAARAEANPTGHAARSTERKISRALTTQGRHAEALARAPAHELLALGRKLHPAEQWALRIQAEEAPVSSRLAALANELHDATGATRKRLQKRYQLTVQARDHLDETSGRPTVTSPKLRKVYAKMQQVAGGRENLIQQLGLMTDEELQAAKTDRMRAAAGSPFEKPTPGKLGLSPSLDRARAHVESLQRRYDQLAAKGDVGGYREHSRPRTPAEAKSLLTKLEGKHAKFEQAVYDRLFTEKLTPEERSAQNYRNVENARARRQASGKNRAGRAAGYSGRKSVLRPLVRDERWQQVEAEVQRALRAAGNHPSAKRMLAERDLIHHLRSQLETAPEEAFGGPRAPRDFGAVSEAVYKGPTRPRLERLGGALSIAKDKLAQQEARAANRVKPTGLLGNRHLEASPQALHVPDIEQGRGGRGRVSGLAQTGALGEPRSPVRRGYTGGAKRYGSEPLNTTRAVAESGLAINRYHRIIELRDKLRLAAHPSPEGMRDPVAIRLDNAEARLPRQVRDFVTDPNSVRPDEAQTLTERVRRNVLLAPEDQAAFDRLHEQGRIGWVERRLLGDMGKSQAPLSATLGRVPLAVVDGINNAQRAAILYLKPAYAVPNMLGNAALGLIHEGFAAPRNLAQASRLHWMLGPELTARIDTLVGEGIGAALSGEGLGQRSVQGAAAIWSRGVDRPFRRAAFLHEARVAGFRTPPQLAKLLTDPAQHDRLINVTQRANEALIDYGNLSTRERQIIRRIIFFYPWVKGSTIYAGHFLAEHQIKAAVAAHLGQLGRERSQQELGPTPSYLEGSFKVGEHSLVNPSSATIFQTPAQAAATALSFIPGGPHMRAALPAQFLTPAEELALAEIEKANPQTGHQYKQGESIAKDVLVRGLPQYQLLQALEGHQTSKLYQRGPGDAVGKFMVGGLYPTRYRPAYLRQLAAKERAGK